MTSNHSRHCKCC